LTKNNICFTIKTAILHKTLFKHSCWGGIAIKPAGVPKECFFMCKEEWKDIDGYENNYRVSNKGRIYSKKRKKILKLYTDKRGYLRIDLYSKGIGKQFVVHRFVAKGFIKNKNPKEYNCVNHLNGKKNDNRSKNLEWCTHEQNMNHASKTGLMHKGKFGVNTMSKKLSSEQVKQIFSLFGKMKYKDISIKFDVSKNSIKDIFYGVTWSWLTGIKRRDYRKRKI